MQKSKIMLVGAGAQESILANLALRHGLEVVCVDQPTEVLETAMELSKTSHVVIVDQDIDYDMVLDAFETAKSFKAEVALVKAFQDDLILTKQVRFNEDPEPHIPKHLKRRLPNR